LFGLTVQPHNLGHGAGTGMMIFAYLGRYKATLWVTITSPAGVKRFKGSSNSNQFSRQNFERQPLSHYRYQFFKTKFSNIKMVAKKI
jgi:hypothetical protein